MESPNRKDSQMISLFLILGGLTLLLVLLLQVVIFNPETAADWVGMATR